MQGNKQQGECVFCHAEQIAEYIIKETTHLRIVADYAPLVEGHLLIIPKDHYTCYGDVPAALDEELLQLKQEVRCFFEHYYASPIYWEHGIFRQTVFHAHLHCFPLGEIVYDLSNGLHAQSIESQDSLRAWHTAHGHYFYLEDSEHALIFPPEMEYYHTISKNVLWPAVKARTRQIIWRTPQQRRKEGVPLIAATIAKWQQFQEQEKRSNTW